MAITTRVALFGMLMGAFACGEQGVPQTPIDSQAQRFARPVSAFFSGVYPRFWGASPSITVDTARLSIDGEYPDRVVAQLPGLGVPCPAPLVNWTARRLFQTSSSPASIPRGMRRYCLYTWTGTGQPTAQAFQQGSSVESVRDHMAVAPASALTLAEVTQAGYAEEYGAAVGQPPVQTGLNAILPRIAILDTSPDSTLGTPGWHTLGLNDHGYALANMVQNLQIVPGLAGAPPASLVTTRLTMDLYVDPTTLEVERDPMGGGDFGTIGVLAEKIHEEVDAWRNRGVGEPLIVNLSLGWDPLYGGDAGTPDTWPFDVQAVYDALYEAACEGAVVVASSGNRAGGPDGAMNPIFPAAWGDRVVDDVGCADLLGGAPLDYADLDEKPLIYAVGGVDEEGRDLAVSRLNSRPAIVAYGDHAVDTDYLGAYTSILTGTSVSSAVVAAVAGVAWHNTPTRAGYEVMESVTESGWDTNDISNAFCAAGPGGCGPARVVDMCRAIQYTCMVKYPGDCVHVPPMAPCPVTPVDGTPDPADIASFESGAITMPLAFPFAPRAASDCSGGAIDLYNEDPWRASDPCPHQQYYDFAVEPWTQPQPTHDTCPPCYIDTGAGQVYLEWEGKLSDLDSLSLYLKDGSGNVKSYTTKSVPPTDTVIYTVSSSVFTGIETAWITGVMGEQSYSVAIELR
jgi:hypothetical protein